MTTPDQGLQVVPPMETPAYKKLWLPAAVALVAGMLVHFARYANGLMTPDGVWQAEQSFSGVWEVSLGRWGLYLVDLLHSGVNSPSLMAFLAILYIAVAGALLSDILQVQSLVKASLISISLTCSPLVSVFLAYPYCGDAYALAFLLAVFTVYAVARAPKRVLGVGLGAVCTAFSTGLYQASLGAMLATAAGFVLMSLLRKPDRAKDIARNMAWLLVTVALGMALYYGAMRLSLVLWSAHMADYKGASVFSLSAVFENLKTSIPSAYQKFQSFYLQRWPAKNAYGEIYAYSAIALVALVSLVIRLGQLLKRHPLETLTAVVVLAIFPLCCNVIHIVLPDSETYLMMAFGMMITMPLLLAITGRYQDERQPLELEKQAAVPRLQTLTGRVSVALAALLVWAYALTIQTDTLVAQIGKDQTLQLANRVWQQVEGHEAYTTNETPVLIAGSPQQGNYPNPSRLYDKANVHAAWGLVWESFDGSVHTWREVYRLYLGVTYVICPPEQFMEIAATEAFRLMPLYPAEGSVQMIGEVLVAKISEVEDWV